MRVLLVVLCIFSILSFQPISQPKADFIQDVEAQVHPVTVFLEPKGAKKLQSMVFVSPFRFNVNKIVYYDSLMTQVGWYVERHKDGKIICSIAQCCGNKPKEVHIGKLPEHAKKMIKKLNESTNKNFYIICEPAYIQVATTVGLDKNTWKQIGEIFLSDLLTRYPETIIGPSEIPFDLPSRLATNK